ncbi:hypothetical protein D9758_003491 [Tetrapyrgos nigripes]|uniref:RING-type domain-containing protein n=1 Tax=Tetrapyrgos nigripes TaxID=182062 RepID=A0A8H5GVC9_9AGAR|nr:hypothetical protein D9758_003491 [Tetrapyrgos nigripes]
MQWPGTLRSLMQRKEKKGHVHTNNCWVGMLFYRTEPLSGISGPDAFDYIGSHYVLFSFISSDERGHEMPSYCPCVFISAILSLSFIFVALLTFLPLMEPRPVQDTVRVAIPDLEFATTDRIHYTRRLYGKERMAAINSGLGKGYGQLISMGDLRFKQILSREELSTHVRAAWIRLRFQAPWFAYRCKTLNGFEPNSFYFEYKKSSKADVAEAWADESIFWRTESLSHQEWELEMKKIRWEPGSGHVAVEMHIAKGKEPNQWFFMYTFPHQTADARGACGALDTFLKNLQEELEGRAESYHNLPWGEEISRLTPTAALMVPDVGASDLPAPSQKPASTQFQRIPLQECQVAGSDEIYQLVCLSVEETKAVLTNCKRYKASLTAVINSILVLAEIETVLQLAADASPDEYAKIIESFKTSDVFTVAVNIADMHSYVYPKYAKALGGCGTGGCINVAFPTHHNMDHIRRCISVGIDGQITRNFSGSGFWDGVVPDTQKGLVSGGRQPPHAFHVLDQLNEKMAPQIKNFHLLTQSVVASSLGSVERVGLFQPFAPANAEKYPNSLFYIEDWIFGMCATNLPARVGHTWEYNGRLYMNLQGSSKWQTEKSFRLFAESIRARLDQIMSITFELEGEEEDQPHTRVPWRIIFEGEIRTREGKSSSANLWLQLTQNLPSYPTHSLESCNTMLHSEQRLSMINKRSYSLYIRDTYYAGLLKPLVSTLNTPIHDMDQNTPTIAAELRPEQIDQILDNLPRPSYHLASLDASADVDLSSSSPLPQRVHWAMERLKKLFSELEPEQLVFVLPKMRKLMERAKQNKGLDFPEFDQFLRYSGLGRLLIVKEKKGKIPVVRYLPCISDFPPSELNGPAPPEWLAMFVHSDVPSVCIEDYNACCNICLEDFEEPPLALEFQVDANDDDGIQASTKPLRQLICGHVLHEECLPMFQSDDYDETFECPACRAEVWTSLSFSLLSAEIPRNAAHNSISSDRQETYDDYYDTLPPWEKIHRKLLDWVTSLPISELDVALNSTAHGRMVNDIALHIWTSWTYKRYIYSRMTDSPGGVVDCLCVDSRMAWMISNSISRGEHRDAGRMLRESWDTFGLEDAPRLLVVLAKHFSDQRHWVVHKFSLPDGALTTYDFFPEPDAFPASRTTKLWWSAFRLAWPDAAICPIPGMPKPKLVRVRQPMQLAVDESVAAAGVWRNILMGLPAEQNPDLEHLRDAICTEVDSFRQTYTSWANHLSMFFGDLYGKI